MVEIIEDKKLFKDHAKIVFDTREDSEERDKWLSMRSSSLGGSEIAKVAGYSKYGSALTVFNEKLGLSEKFKGNIHTQFGNRMEPHIREWVQEDFKKATGIELKTYEYPFMMISKEYERFSANIDGLAVTSQHFNYYENKDTGEIKQIAAGELIGLEIKTAGEFLQKMWAGEEIPSEYYCQCQWYMGVTGLKYFLIVYLLGKEVNWKVIPRHEDDIKALFQIGKDFWENNIETLTAPNPVGLEAETKDILYQQELQEDEVEVTGSNLIKYQEVSENIKELEKEKERLKQEIFLEMGNAKKAIGGGFKLSRYTVSRDKTNLKLLKEKYPLTYQAILEGKTEYVNMRISKLK